MIRIVVTIFILCILYYFMLPPLNLTSPLFYVYLLLGFLTYLSTMLLYLCDSKSIITDFSKKKQKNLSKKATYFFLIIICILGLPFFINIIQSPIFHAKSYANRININTDRNFIEDIKPVNFESLPLLDKDSSQKLGDRVMGQMPELVSQFEVSDLYTQINYNNEIVRVTPLEYASIFKYFSNHKEGIKGYITVNSITGEAKLTKMEKGMKYMPSSILNENLYRHIRFTYPTQIFGDANFELDNEGNPYWVIPTIKYSGIGLKKEITGVVIVDPITGKSEKYDSKNVPTWIDHVYSPELIIEQVDDWGKYSKGFMNSLFGQKDVTQTTTGYNYTIMNDDVYLYTGITSVAQDESNIGFILCNLRTKETNFYKVPGAEEYSAMASAEGQVQQMSYTSTFPLLINLNDEPTYLVSLKDNAGLVKMYAFIDVEDYQKVVVTDATKGIEEAARNYLENISFPTNTTTTQTKQIKIAYIKEAQIDGNTIYYLEDINNQRYKVNIKVNSNLLPFLIVGNQVEIHYTKQQEVIEITKINLLNP